MKRSWPGTSTTPAAVPSGKIEVGKTQIDGDAALFFFLEPVGVLARQRFDQAGFPVIDMAGGADDVGHAKNFKLNNSKLPDHSRSKFGMRSSASKIVLKSSRKRSSLMLPMIGGSAARNCCAMAVALSFWVFDANDDGRQFFGRQGAAADLRSRFFQLNTKSITEVAWSLGNQLLRRARGFHQAAG